MNDKIVANELKRIADELSKGDVYKSLNDASSIDDGLSKGNTEIFYVKNMRNVIGDYFEGENKVKTISKDDFDNGYVLLGMIRETNADKIFELMQGETWSPNGEANNLIRSKGLEHTSMSVGDVIRIGNKYLYCGSIGWRKMEVK